MPELQVDLIVKAALAVAERAGPDGLTMRALADELGVTPTALYRHVEDKKALISLMVDAVVTEHELPAPTGDWREDMWRMAKAMREMALGHPAVSELRRGHQIWTPAVLPLTERWMSLWLQTGLPLEDALRAAVITSLSITGIADGELLLRGMQRPEPSALTWVPNARLAFDADRDVDADFELVVRSLIEGVYARLAAAVEDRATA